MDLYYFINGVKFKVISSTLIKIKGIELRLSKPLTYGELVKLSKIVK